jgi:BirA family biotin operon repressor/biotin-[acetyl-CoA-carboxylase] ligase
MERPLDALKLQTRWVGRSLEYLAQTESTNLVAHARARAGAPEGTVVLADRQTAGRGRLGRSFFSPGGVSVYFSLILRPQAPPERLHENVFAAAVAVADAAAEHLGPERVAIKWPNDVLLDGRKTSGINAPAQISAGRTEFLVLGVGVNVNTRPEDFPPELRQTATSLRIAAGAPLDRTAFAEGLLARLEREIDRLRGAGFASVLERWRIYFRMRGSRVRISVPGASGVSTSGGTTNSGATTSGVSTSGSTTEGGTREREGIAEDVDPDGALVLRVATGAGSSRERIVAGDVALLE